MLLHLDQIGSVRMVEFPTEGIVKGILYDAFGNVVKDANPYLRSPLGFAGGLHDWDTGLVRFGWRDYDPDTGRFTGQDPLGAAGGDPDWYGYCLDDPVNGRDPEGLQDEEIQREAYDLRTLPGIGQTMLANDVALKVDEWQKKLRDDDTIELKFHQGFRSTKTQANLHDNPNAITPAKPGTSLHEAGRAVDINLDSTGYSDEQKEQIIQSAKNAGIKWGGEFSSPDRPHFYDEVPGGRENRSRFIKDAQKTGRLFE